MSAVFHFMDKILPQVFMLLKKEERDLVAKVFGLVKNGVSEIRDQEVISDGHTLEDLSAITADKMASYVGSMESFSRLWELTVAKIHSELNPPVGLIVNGTIEAVPAPISPAITVEITPEQKIELNNAPSIEEVGKKKKGK